MKYEKLKNQPDGILFHEMDLPSMPIFQKIETVENDIIVRHFNEDFEQSRFGFREMDETDRNSKDFHVFDMGEIAQIQEWLTDAGYAVDNGYMNLSHSIS